MSHPRSRAEILALIPPGYNGVGHFLFLHAMGVPPILWALWQVKGLRAWELLSVPVAFLLGNMAEWALHRYVLHQRLPLLHPLYHRHAVLHHGAFHHDSMEAPTPREWRWVLFPALSIFPLLAIVAGFVTPLGLYLGANVAYLAFVTLVGSYLLYEWLHLSYHLPASSPLGGSPFIHWLRRHHQQHHHPRFAKLYNFNVTFPIWDWVRGTILPPQLAQQMDEELR